MKKPITVIPETSQIHDQLQALRIRNGFIKAGFRSKKPFIKIVQDYLPEFKDYHEAEKLYSWWLGRAWWAEFNPKLETVLNQLINE